MKRDLVLADHGPGKQVLGICRGVFNGLDLGPENVERLLKNGGWFKQGFLELVAGYSSLDWHIEPDGTIYFWVYANGRTGPEWVRHFIQKGVDMPDRVVRLLMSEHFVPSKAKRTNYKIAVIRGHIMRRRKGGASQVNILAEGEARELNRANLEVACLIRDTFTDDELKRMGLWYIMVMHEYYPDPDKEGYSFVLGATRGDLPEGCKDPDPSKLHDFHHSTEGMWASEGGFAFIERQFPVNI